MNRRKDTLGDATESLINVISGVGVPGMLVSCCDENEQINVDCGPDSVAEDRRKLRQLTSHGWSGWPVNVTVPK